MKNMKFITTIISVLFFQACGGGGKADTPNATNMTTAPDISPPRSAPIAKTKDLVVSAEYNLETYAKYKVYVDIGNRLSDAAYINLCEINENQINYRKCILRSKVQNGSLVADVTVDNHFGGLIAEVINLRNPQQYELFQWRKDEMQDRNTLSIK